VLCVASESYTRMSHGSNGFLKKSHERVAWDSSGSMEVLNHQPHAPRGYGSYPSDEQFKKS
jgi:hypothetical protein